MFAISACIGTPAVLVHGAGQQPASGELPAALPNTPRGSGELRGSLRRTLLAQSSLVERGSDLLVNVGLESPRADSDTARSRSFQRLPSVGAAAGRVRPQRDGEQPRPEADAAAAADVAAAGGDWGVQDLERRQQRRRLDGEQQRQLGSSLLAAAAAAGAAAAPAGPLTAARPARPALQALVDPFKAAFDQIMEDDDLADEGAEAAESDASSLPEEGPSQLSAFHWTASRKRLEECLEAAEAETRAHPEADYLDGPDRLADRLAALELVCVQAVGDGNCLFRAMSEQLYGSQRYHLALRATAVEHMRENADAFMGYLGDEWEAYLASMACSGTWGDELTLRALSDALCMRVLVITSEQQNWLLRYDPEMDLPKLEVFLAYESPVHYNAVRRLSTVRRLMASLPLSRSRRMAGAASVVGAF